MKTFLAFALIIAAAYAAPGLPKAEKDFTRSMYKKPMLPPTPDMLRKLRNRDSSKIIGGRECELHEFPSLASVTFGGGYLCSGQVIHENWVMTAGHCCWEQPGVTYPVNSYTVRVGAHHRFFDNEQDDPMATDHSVSEVLGNQQYNSDIIRYDICLLRMEDPIIMNEHTQPAVLATRENNACGTAGTIVEPAGYGKTCGVGCSASEVCMTTTDPVLDDDICRSTYFIEHPPSECCIAYEGSGTCNGDSGGPLYSRGSDGTQITNGITSYGTVFCPEGVPDVFTEVAYFNSDIPGENDDPADNFWIYRTSGGDVGASA